MEDHKIILSEESTEMFENIIEDMNARGYDAVNIPLLISGIIESESGLLKDYIEIPNIPDGVDYNYIYYPVLFKNEEQLLRVLDALKSNDIYARRYFYPSLNKLSIFECNENYPVSEDISNRIACLPMDTYLKSEEIEEICRIIKESI